MKRKECQCRSRCGCEKHRKGAGLSELKWLLANTRYGRAARRLSTVIFASQAYWRKP